MALSSKDFKKLGIIVIIIALVLISLLFGFFNKSCSQSTLTREGDRESSSQAISLKIESVIETPTEKESVTLINTGSRTISLKDWTLGDKNEPEARGLAGELKAGARKVYDRESLGFGINDYNEVIYLKYKGQTKDRWEGKAGRDK